MPFIASMTHRGKRRIIDAICIALLFLAGGVALLFVWINNLPRDTAPVVDVTKKSVTNQTPALKTEVIIGGLDHPWEVAFLPDATTLITERNGDISKIVGGRKTVLQRPDDVVARGEGGMLGMAVDPKFTDNRYIYTCFNSSRSGADVRVARWKLDSALATLADRQDIVTGMPSQVGGRHSGCRLGFGADGHLWIGTGDAAQVGNPQNLQNLGGKILRVDRDGKPAADNLGGGADARIYSYGHRNTQGMAFYKTPKHGSYGVSIEHGPSVDDEINSLIKGNFGWAPMGIYDEKEPMTDLARFPAAVKSIWSSGRPTLAVSDADFLNGPKWGKWQGRLAMATLKEQHLRLLELKDDGTIAEELKLFDHQFGRLRAVTIHTDGSLYITTDNGNSQDYVLRITPDL